MVLNMSPRLSPDLQARFAALCQDLGKGATPPEIWPSYKGVTRSAASSCSRGSAIASGSQSGTGSWRAIAARYHGLVHKLDKLRDGAVLGLREGATPSGVPSGSRRR